MLLNKLLVYNNLREDVLVKKALRLLEELETSGNAPEQGMKDGSACMGEIRSYRELYYDVQRTLLEFASGWSEQIGGGATFWEQYICGLIAESVNIFSQQADKGQVSGDVFALAVREMQTLKDIYSLKWDEIASVWGDEASNVAGMRVSGSIKKRKAIHAALTMEDDVKSAAALADYYKRESCGIFESYDAFHWLGSGKDGKDGALQGVKPTDPISFEDLIGYEIQKKKIVENAEFFVRGAAGANMLLYGDRGTGKSSCVKALLNKYAAEKLRLVAVSKDEIGALQEVMGRLAQNGCRFIIFIDDLSFEENETGYKSFKSALEGSVMSQPENVMVCVTSNRRNIIKEIWRDREGQDDINVNDALQEKRSLADRFGLTVTFSAPDKGEYLDIVRGIAAREELGIDEETLTREAMKWEIRHSGKSGRTARQFVNYISRTGV